MGIGVISGFSYTGGPEGEIIIQRAETVPPNPEAIDGGGGNDVIIGDHDSMVTDSSTTNNSFGSALVIDDPSTWSTAADMNVGNPAIPYTSMAVNGAGQPDFFAVTVGVGQTITIDIDYANKPGSLGGSVSFDSVLTLYAPGGSQLAFSDDSANDFGSTDGRDSSLTYTVGAGGTYYFEIRQYNAAAVPEGASYLVNVSVTGHAMTNTVLPNDDMLFGGAGNDMLQGGGGNDTIFGGIGGDVAYGGAGNDKFYDESDGSGDVFYGGDGDDIIYLAANGGGTSFFDTIGNDTISAENSSQGWTIDLQTGIGNAAGASASFTASAIETLIGSGYSDTLTAATGGSRMSGGGGNDQLYGAAGNDVVDGGDGDDVMDGGGGIDRVSYASAAGGVIVELSQTGPQGTLAGGTDTLSGFVNLTGSAYGDSLGGSDAANGIDGGQGDDYIDGGTGNDMLDGGAGFDVATYFNSTSAVKVNLNLTTAQNTGQQGTDSLVNIEGVWGSSYNDVLTGNNADNWFQGGFGADIMAGGNGNDSYVVDNAGDKVIENAGQGGDTVTSSISYSLAGQYLEVLNLTGNTAINGSGNGLANTINGNSGANALNGADGNDRLDGGGGADKMTGGLGNDVFVVDNVADKIVENSGEGNDTCEASISYSLAGQYIETLRLTGTGDINGTGNGQVNSLYGNSGANRLDGGIGADTMVGGAGNDRFIVDNVGDKVFELADEGSDTVESSVSYSLAGQFADDIKLTGTAAINATGNGLVNILTGNVAANGLNGGAENDQLHGMAGLDTLTGGPGRDGFWFETALGSGNVDTIKDFKALDDVIVLDRSIFTALPEGILAGAAMHAGTSAGDASDRIIYDQATGKLYYDPDGTGAAAQVQFAFLANFATAEIDENNFFIVP